MFMACCWEVVTVESQGIPVSDYTTTTATTTATTTTTTISSLAISIRW